MRDTDADRLGRAIERLADAAERAYPKRKKDEDATPVVAQPGDTRERLPEEAPTLAGNSQDVSPPHPAPLDPAKAEAEAEKEAAAHRAEAANGKKKTHR